ncbi:MAG: hypothetical protein Q4G39_05105 [Brachymonas sp.]|nr:hypothetical protein [Brachymonas sp.]
MTNSDNASPMLPAAGDVVVAWPQEPQQLFLILHGAAQTPAHWQALAQDLAQHFPQGLVVALSTPAVLLQGEVDLPAELPAATNALRALVQNWQTHTGLGFERTALIATGMAASTALHAVAAHADVAARLFAVGGKLAQPLPIAADTTLHWLHGASDASMREEQAHTTAQQLRALDVDFTLDVLPGSCTVCTADLQQRVLHLLQNHVPQRLWREAMKAAGQDVAAAPDQPLH